MKHCVWIFLALTFSSYCQTPGNGVTDIDGNIYNSVIIGTQEWTKENLNVSKYSDGTPIPQVTDPTAWANLTTGAWCYYENNTVNGPICGKLYNWYAVAGIHDTDPSTPNKILAPQGWHVPSDTEWFTLTTFLGGGSVAGGKMKSTDINFLVWFSPNTAATNESGFTGLPAGWRIVINNNRDFEFIGQYSFWWSSSEDVTQPSRAWSRFLSYENDNASRVNYDKVFGMSVRLINNTLLDNQSIKSNSFNIYPNPAKDHIIIDVSNINDMNSWSYKIVNALGQEVINGKISSQQNIVQLNNLKGHGVYFVKIYDSSNKLMDTKKIIIKQ